MTGECPRGQCDQVTGVQSPVSDVKMRERTQCGYNPSILCAPALRSAADTQHGPQFVCVTPTVRLLVMRECSQGRHRAEQHS